MPSSRARMPSSGPLIAALTLSRLAGVTAPSPGSAGYSPDFAGPLPRLRRVLPRLRGIPPPPAPPGTPPTSRGRDAPWHGPVTLPLAAESPAQAESESHVRGARGGVAGAEVQHRTAPRRR